MDGSKLFTIQKPGCDQKTVTFEWIHLLSTKKHYKAQPMRVRATMEHTGWNMDTCIQVNPEISANGAE